MKKKLVGILIVMLFITTAIFPVAYAINIKTTIENEKNVVTAGDRPYIEVFLPDVHVYVHKSHIQWGTVEFDEPGAVIHVDLSEIEEDEVLLIISHKIICHVEGQILPASVLSSVCRPNSSYSSSHEIIGFSDNWKRTVGHGTFEIKKVEDETYPLIVAVTGVPLLFRWAVGMYFTLMLIFFPEILFDYPTPLEQTYGTVTEYQLHVHT